MELVNVKDLNQSQWKSYYSLYNTLSKNSKFSKKYDTLEDFLKGRIEYLKKFKADGYVIVDKNKCVAYLSLFYFNEYAKEVDLSINYNSRKLSESILKKLKIFLTTYMNEKKLNTIRIYAINEKIKDFGKALVGKPHTVFINYKLQFNEINISKFQKIIDSIASNNTGLKTKLYINYPDEILDEYIKLIQDITKEYNKYNDSDYSCDSKKDIVEARKNNKLNNITRYTNTLENENNEMVAMTNVFINGLNPNTVIHSITGVKKKYRGRGFAKWLKSDLYLKLKSLNPKLETIYSGNNTKNFYISRVNESIGMKPDRKEYEYIFKIK